MMTRLTFFGMSSRRNLFSAGCFGLIDAPMRLIDATCVLCFMVEGLGPPAVDRCHLRTQPEITGSQSFVHRITLCRSVAFALLCGADLGFRA